jgi:Domain of unknown function (DUF4149)
MLYRLPGYAAALWWASLTAIGFFVVPMLFVHLPSPALAGTMAARLFGAQTWVSVGCALLILLFSQPKRRQVLAEWTSSAIVFVVLGMLLALLQEFAVSPRIVARENLKLWHSVGTGLFAFQWACAGAVLWQALRPAHPLNTTRED